MDALVDTLQKHILDIMRRSKHRFTATQRATTAIGRNAVDEDGRLKPTSTSTNVTTFSFWGDIKEYPAPTETLVAGKRHYIRTIKIHADSRSVANLNIDDTLTFDNNTDRWQVVDIYESDFTRTSEIIAKLNR